MRIPFTKMQGAGNDYVYIDCFETSVESLPDIANLSRRISDRHFGVGSDGLVLIMPSDNGSNVRMRMFNSDGSESQMCGNASRCVARYAYDNHLIDSKQISLQTQAGNKQIEILPDGFITVNMGNPVVIAEHETLKIDDEKYDYTAVSMGNPHCVIFVDDVKNFPVEIVGKKIEVHPNFPERTNVEFVKIIDNQHLEMRVWERGAGETLACGTGACATAVAAILNRFSVRETNIQLLGGCLKIRWSKTDNCVYMTGGAEKVFDGVFDYI